MADPDEAKTTGRPEVWARTDLARWGWAPGAYIGGRCLECGRKLPPHAKRAWHCAPCAADAEWRAAGIETKLDAEYGPRLI